MKKFKKDIMQKFKGKKIKQWKGLRKYYKRWERWKGIKRWKDERLKELKYIEKCKKWICWKD